MILFSIEKGDKQQIAEISIAAIVSSPFSIQNGIHDICCFRGINLTVFPPPPSLLHN